MDHLKKFVPNTANAQSTGGFKIVQKAKGDFDIGGWAMNMIVDLFGALTHAVFGVINILMRLAPIGAFGAMAFTIGRYGLASLGPLVRLIATF